MEADWVAWQKQEHIPDVMASGCFTHYYFFRLLTQDADGGITYVVQYFAGSMNDYQRYIDEAASRLRQKAFEKWGNRFIAFRTLMEAVN